MTFLIDSTKVKIQNLPCDDNGSYLASGSHTLTYKIVGDDHSEVELVSRKREIPQFNGERYLYLRRIYRTNKACKNFRQIGTYLEDTQGNIVNNTVLLQYNFKGKETLFEAKPHGNSKNKSTSFLPTNKSTIHEIKEVAKQMKPKKAILSLTKSEDLLTATSSANMNRDRKQIYNMRSSSTGGTKSNCKDKDELYAVMLQAAAEEENGAEVVQRKEDGWDIIQVSDNEGTKTTLERDPNRPRYTRAELQEILTERNMLKEECFSLREELSWYKPK